MRKKRNRRLSCFYSEVAAVALVSLNSPDAALLPCPLLLDTFFVVCCYTSLLLEFYLLPDADTSQ